MADSIYATPPGPEPAVSPPQAGFAEPSAPPPTGGTISPTVPELRVDGAAFAPPSGGEVKITILGKTVSFAQLQMGFVGIVVLLVIVVLGYGGSQGTDTPPVTQDDSSLPIPLAPSPVFGQHGGTPTAGPTPTPLRAPPPPPSPPSPTRPPPSPPGCQDVRTQAIHHLLRTSLTYRLCFQVHCDYSAWSQSVLHAVPHSYPFSGAQSDTSHDGSIRFAAQFGDSWTSYIFHSCVVGGEYNHQVACEQAVRQTSFGVEKTVFR